MRDTIVTLGLTSIFLLSGCVTTDQGQRIVGEKATDKASTAAMLELESAKAEDTIRRSGDRIIDPDLERYVQTIAEASAGDFGEEINVYLLQAPVFNAFMMPNGTMGVYSGLLLRAETEDELALVLGHEFGHYYEKHVEERFAAANNANILYAATGYSLIGLIVAGAEISSFSRSQESEADKIGAEILPGTGYDSAVAIRLWDNLEAEKKASSIRAVRKRGSSIFDTHPTSLERLDTLKTLVGVEGPLPEPSAEKREAYRAIIRPYLLTWLEDEIGRRDAGSTLHLLDRLDAVPGDEGTLLYARARVIDRALSNKRLKKDKLTRKLMETYSPETVIELLEASTSNADAPAQAHRELGNRLYKAGRHTEASRAFQVYLDQNPAAKDAALIKSLMLKSEGSS